MGPKSSSASSGTRKKHARKAAAGSEPPEPPHHPPQRGEKKGKKHRSDPPRPKVYIAPIKPTARNPDPLDAVPGLAQRLPPPLLVVLRSLGKKAMVTKVRALEELWSGWVCKIGVRDEDGGVAEYALRDAVPVWLHHVPAHLVHPARRVRLLTAQVHAAMRPLFGDEHDVPDVVNCVWALAAHDPDRAVAAVAGAPAVRATTEECAGLVEFLERVVLHTDGVYNELNPPAPVLLSHPPDPYAAGTKGAYAKGPHAKGVKHPQAQATRSTGVSTPTPPPGRSRGDEQDLESAFDRRARLRIAAFGALKYLLETTPSLPLPPFLASPALWSALQDSSNASYYDDIASSLRASSTSPTPKIAEDKDGDEEGEEDEDDDAYTAYLRAEIAAPPIQLRSSPNDEGSDADPDADTLPLGRAQPALRRAAWALVVALLARARSRPRSSVDDSVSADATQSTLQPGVVQVQAVQQQPQPQPPALTLTLAHALLPALWGEADAGVQGGMWRGGLGWVHTPPRGRSPRRRAGLMRFVRGFISFSYNSSFSTPCHPPFSSPSRFSRARRSFTTIPPSPPLAIHTNRLNANALSSLPPLPPFSTASSTTTPPSPPLAIHTNRLNANAPSSLPPLPPFSTASSTTTPPSPPLAIHTNRLNANAPSSLPALPPFSTVSSTTTPPSPPLATHTNRLNPNAPSSLPPLLPFSTAPLAPPPPPPPSPLILPTAPFTQTTTHSPPAPHCSPQRPTPSFHTSHHLTCSPTLFLLPTPSALSSSSFPS
ncbi:hypothetical protein K438DRAFT_1952521 [Mycena galopus ATCC 62051]|nr:hypothetical protein K438DRAFT_1952521 [Mycena galopus ATCC 62051]